MPSIAKLSAPPPKATQAAPSASSQQPSDSPFKDFMDAAQQPPAPAPKPPAAPAAQCKTTNKKPADKSASDESSDDSDTTTSAAADKPATGDAKAPEADATVEDDSDAKETKNSKDPKDVKKDPKAVLDAKAITQPGDLTIQYQDLHVTADLPKPLASTPDAKPLPQAGDGKAKGPPTAAVAAGTGKVPAPLPQPNDKTQPSAPAIPLKAPKGKHLLTPASTSDDTAPAKAARTPDSDAPKAAALPAANDAELPDPPEALPASIHQKQQTSDQQTPQQQDQNSHQNSNSPQASALPNALDAAVDASAASPAIHLPIPDDSAPAPIGPHTITPLVSIDSSAAPQANQSATVASPAQDSPAFNAPQTMDQIVLGLRGKIDAKNQIAEIHLEPQNLGSVHVSIAVSNGILTADFHASNHMVQDLLSSQLDKLRNVLEGQDITVDRLSVAAKADPAAIAMPQPSTASNGRDVGTQNQDGRSAGNFGHRGQQNAPRRDSGQGSFAAAWKQAAIDLVA